MGYDMYFHDKGFDSGDEGYFRLNMGGMHWCSDEMAARGMTFDAGQHPPFPDNWDDKPAVDAVLSWHGPEMPGIPAHKFWSNDGWIVTPAECQAAVRTGRASPPPAEHAGIWERWLDYLDRASHHEGFEVH